MKKITIEISARHVHLSQQDLDTLFGAGAQLTPKRELSQPGQYLCEQRVSLIGPRSNMNNVAILGPVRKTTQVEVSLTDARSLGVTAAIRESGNIEGTEGITIQGPNGSITTACGVIAAKRHLHASPEDAEKLGIKDKQIIKVRTTVEGRRLIFDDVVVRVSPDFRTYMHIDYDEANAAGLTGETEGEIID